jgi:hypothetical protein
MERQKGARAGVWSEQESPSMMMGPSILGAALIGALAGGVVAFAMHVRQSALSSTLKDPLVM